MKRARISAVHGSGGLSRASADQPSEAAGVLVPGTGLRTGSHNRQRRFVKRAFSLFGSDWRFFVIVQSHKQNDGAYARSPDLSVS